MPGVLSRTGRWLVMLAGVSAGAAGGCVSGDAQRAASPGHDHAERALAGPVATDRFRENFAGQGHGLLARRLNTEFWALYRIDGSDEPLNRIIVVEVPQWTERSLLGATSHLPFEGDVVVNADSADRTLEFVTRGATLRRFEVRLGERPRRGEHAVVASAAVSLTIDQSELDRLMADVFDGAEHDQPWHEVLFGSRKLATRLGFYGRGPEFDCQAGGHGAIGASMQIGGQRVAMEVNRSDHVCLGNLGTKDQPELWARAFSDR